MTDARSFALTVVRKLRDAGFQALWAGGCVRDQLLGLTPQDYDVATDARPPQVRSLFRRTIEVGASFGVVEVLGPRIDGATLKVQVATFRVEGPYSDGRRPDEVEFATPDEDAQRRDFTINGMFYDPVAARLIDYVGGEADLRAKMLRAIGDPVERFAEDKLRLLRAVRFAARFDLQMEAATREAIRTMAGQITVVSAERIADEFRKMLTHPSRVRAMNLLWDVGLVPPLLPELVPMKGLPQGPPEAATGDLWEHVMRVLGRLEEASSLTQQTRTAISFPLAFAALLHDVGKPRTIERLPDRYTFHGHEHVGRRLASEICLRFRLSNAERERVEWLVEKHQYLCDAKQMKHSKLKVILSQPGIYELLTLHRADALAANRATEHVAFCEQLLQQWSPAELNPPPLIRGEDLMELGLEPGPLFKELLDRVRESQLDGSIATHEDAIRLADQILKEKALR